MSKKFKQQDSKLFKKIGTNWRRAKGSQSKMRKHKRGAGIMPSIGYRSPAEKRDMVNGKALEEIYNNNLEEVKKGDVLRLSGKIGKRKLLEIEEKAKKLGLIIFNKKRIKSAKKLLESITKKKEDNKAKEKKEVEKKKDSTPDTDKKTSVEKDTKEEEK